MNMTALVHPFPSRARVRPPDPRVWLLLSNRPGDNNQLFALAEALGYRFEAKDLRFNRRRKLRPLNGSGLAGIAPESRRLIQPPWPELVIGAGYPAVPIARYIRGQSDGRTKIVHVGNARERIDDFDLHLTTPQYPAMASPNTIELPFPIGNPAKAVQPTREELEWLDAYPRPRRLIAVGGPARYWELDHGALREAIRTVRDKKPRGSVIVATSHRTLASTRNLLKCFLSPSDEAIVEAFPRFGALLSQADEIYVTADSVSMISEAVLSSKPTGLIPIRRSIRGQFARWLLEPLGRMTLPNFPNFWDQLSRNRLVGTVDIPVASQVCDTIGRAAGAVRSLLAPGDAVDREEFEGFASYMGADRRASGR